MIYDLQAAKRLTIWASIKLGDPAAHFKILGGIGLVVGERVEERCFGWGPVVGLALQA